MSNKKYDNLVPMLASGRLNWPADTIQAFLVKSAVFDATDKRLSDMAGTITQRTTLPERMVDPVTGSFLGYPASFEDALAGIPYAVILAKEDGTQDPWLISFYDANETGGALSLTIAGTLTVRPTGSTPTSPGVWVQFA